MGIVRTSKIDRRVERTHVAALMNSRHDVPAIVVVWVERKGTADFVNLIATAEFMRFHTLHQIRSSAHLGATNSGGDYVPVRAGAVLTRRPLSRRRRGAPPWTSTVNRQPITRTLLRLAL